MRECHQAPPSREEPTETSLNTQVHLVAWARFAQPVSGSVVPSRRIKISKDNSFFSLLFCKMKSHIVQEDLELPL